MWTTLSSNAPKTIDDVDYTTVTTENLCKAAGGKWESSKCAAQ